MNTFTSICELERGTDVNCSVKATIDQMTGKVANFQSIYFPCDGTRTSHIVFMQYYNYLD